ncbi:MAG: DUF4382 domain-containing protein [Thaumarchaeota archaeon]|nr:DUF4382 domain-containing protein [Nitrososphaerota archaeon]
MQSKAAAVAALVILATIGLSGYTYTVYLPSLSQASNGSSNSMIAGPGTGTVAVYLTDNPHSNSSLKYLLVNISDLVLKYEGNLTSNQTSTSSTATNTTSSTTNSTVTTITNSTITSSGTSAPANQCVVSVASGTNINLTSLAGNAILLGQTTCPSGNVTGIIFNITGAKAFFLDGNSKVLKVVADGKLMIPVHFQVFPNGTSTLTVDIQPNDIHVSQGIASILSPVIHVQVVSSHGNTTSSTSSVTTLTSATSTSTNSTSTTSSDSSSTTT